MSEQKYAISEYHNTDEVYKKLNNLVSQPLRPVKHEKMQEFLSYFDTQCKRSKELTDEAKKFIPGGVQHNLAFNYPFPIAVEKADGAYLWDADGNQYIDFLQAGGPTVLGSNYAPVREKVFEMLQSCGPVTGLFHEYELKLAQLVNRFMPAVEMFRMLGSGTESVMAAIRAEREPTPKRNMSSRSAARIMAGATRWFIACMFQARVGSKQKAFHAEAVLLRRNFSRTVSGR